MFNEKNAKWIIPICACCLFIMSIILYKNLPIKEDYLETISFQDTKKYVYPLGEVVGIKADTDGVFVVGYEDDSVEYVGGMKIGDNIIRIDDKKINNMNDVSNTLSNLTTDTVKLTFERDNKLKMEEIKVKKDGNVAKLGLWVRNKISGVGTITFYDPTTSKFMGIGHPITDVDTNTLLKIKQGYIYKPTSFEVIKGSKDKVGEIKGEFNEEEPIGKFSNNSNIGISGHMLTEKKKDVQLIEVGKSDDVKLGKASIIFEDEKGNPTSYDVKIVEIIKNSKNNRNLVIEVTDKALLSYTGGIVQGMSGVPIIQNNKIIGAITHVFKDDYKKGYGIFADEMIELDKSY
ncbi:MAG: SpoIVB peptidase S55 domain-containing protein [Peptostreptococcaceae bacterium]